MADNTNGRGYPEPRFDSFVSKATSRRQFIKGVIFSGAAVIGRRLSALDRRLLGSSKAPPAASSGC